MNGMGYDKIAKSHFQFGLCMVDIICRNQIKCLTLEKNRFSILLMKNVVL